MKKTWYYIRRYPVSCRVGHYNEVLCHRFSTEEKLLAEIKEWANDTFYTGIVITELKDNGEMVDRKDLVKKYFGKVKI